VPADPGVQRAGELTRRVVAHDQLHLGAEPPQGGRLELGVLDHGAPERP
jgi:hypothetical protein